MSGPFHLFVRFNDRHAAIACETGALARELQRRWGPIATSADAVVGPPVLHVALARLGASGAEVRDSMGRCERGSLDHAIHHARKSITTAFAEAHVGLVWLHAAAVARGDRAVVIAGPAGAGKSSLAAGLVTRDWLLVADDAVAIDVAHHHALPLPFNPEVRVTPRGDQDWRAFLAQRKALIAVDAARVRSAPAAIDAVVFPTYERGLRAPHVAPLDPVSAAKGLIEQALPGRAGHGRAIAALLGLARHVPCYCLRYADVEAATAGLAFHGVIPRRP